MPKRLAITLIDQEDATASTISIPFKPGSPARKGVAHAAASTETIDETTRATLLCAIARSMRWVKEIISGKTNSFDEVAKREQLAEPQ